MAYREIRVTRAALPHQKLVEHMFRHSIRYILMLEGFILFAMEDYSDSDISLEPEYDSDQESAHGSDCDTDELHENLEPETSESICDEYMNAPWNPKAQLQLRSIPPGFLNCTLT